jgi:hypothetical protein
MGNSTNAQLKVCSLEPKRKWRKDVSQFDSLLADCEDCVIRHIRAKGPVDDKLRLQIGRAVIIGMHWNPDQPTPARLIVVSRRNVSAAQLELFDRPREVK